MQDVKQWKNADIPFPNVSLLHIYNHSLLHEWLRHSYEDASQHVVSRDDIVQQVQSATKEEGYAVEMSTSRMIQPTLQAIFDIKDSMSRADFMIAFAKEAKAVMDQDL